MGCGNENRSEDCSKCCSEGGSPLLQQGELDFSPAKQPPSSKWAFSPGPPRSGHHELARAVAVLELVDRGKVSEPAKVMHPQTA
jgi:hypothetical protein